MNPATHGPRSGTNGHSAVERPAWATSDDHADQPYRYQYTKHPEQKVKLAVLGVQLGFETSYEIVSSHVLQGFHDKIRIPVLQAEVAQQPVQAIVIRSGLTSVGLGLGYVTRVTCDSRCARSIPGLAFILFRTRDACSGTSWCGVLKVEVASALNSQAPLPT